MTLDGRQRGSAGLRRATMALVLSWALTAAVLCGAVFGQSSQPEPNPATASPGPLPGGDLALVLMAAFALSVCLAACPFIAFATGLAYLRGEALSGWRWTTGWAAAAVGGVTVEALLVRAVVLDLLDSARPAVDQPRWAPGQVQLDWGALALSAAFVVAGAAMVAVLGIAARSAGPLLPAAVLPPSGSTGAGRGQRRLTPGCGALSCWHGPRR